MNEKPATQILSRTMKWSQKDVTENLASLQVLSGYGYDEYQQFRPGMRFIESLASWLNQFPQNKRAAAFRFVKEKLLYITQDQMKQIISVTYLDCIVPILLKQISHELEPSIPYWNVAQLLNLNQFKVLLRKCLFVGLSDGSQIDTFRRNNQAIDHEQIYRTHEINYTRTGKIKMALKKDLGCKEPSAHFRNIFLLDDFSGSGLSYLRRSESSPSDMVGKIADFHRSVTNKIDPISELVDIKDLRIWLILYVATEHAKEHLQYLGSKLFSKIPFSVISTHTIPDSIKYRENDDTEFTDLIKNKNFGWRELDTDDHMNTGDNKRPYLGYDSCALPLVLNHNTPNNSLPILHRNDCVKFKGLFPRVSRHQ